MKKEFRVARGKVIEKLELSNADGSIEIQITFTDGSALHFDAKARVVVEPHEFNAGGNLIKEHPAVLQEICS